MPSSSSSTHGTPPAARSATTAEREVRAPHHSPTGGFRNPWPASELRGTRDLLRWMGQRIASGKAFTRDRARFERVPPSFDAPHASSDTLTATWVGHSTVLLQLGGVTVLTDPMWSRRASPLPFLGPRRRVPAAVRLKTLPAIDVTVVSHNHYDHLDARTVRRLRRRAPEMPWVAPLGVAQWLRERRVRHAWELDWWDTLHVGGAAVTAIPARHFSARGIRDRQATLWCGYVIEAEGWRVLFCGDSGMHDEWEAIGSRLGPFDLMMIPIGAYEPRWFMERVHMNPEEAVAAYGALERAGRERAATAEPVAAASGAPGGAAGPRGAPPAGKIQSPRHTPVMLPIHWGTFKLTDEPLDEPPQRTRAAWEAAGHDPDRLWLLRHGETRRMTRGA